MMLVRRVPRAQGSRASMQVVGYVQPSSPTTEDITLSTACAKAVEQARKNRGLTGTHLISGTGQFARTDANGRCVVVTRLPNVTTKPATSFHHHAARGCDASATSNLNR